MPLLLLEINLPDFELSKVLRESGGLFYLKNNIVALIGQFETESILGFEDWRMFNQKFVLPFWKFKYHCLIKSFHLRLYRV
jgi:hypothetical protein